MIAISPRPFGRRRPLALKRLFAIPVLVGAALAAGQAMADATTDWGWLMVGGPAATAANFTGRGVVVGVVDSGIDFSHPAFAGRAFWYEYGAYDPGQSSHGTHVAGILGAADIGAGMQGIAPGVILSSLQVLEGPKALYVGDAPVAAAYDGALAAGVRIFNNSWSIWRPITRWGSRENILAAHATMVGAFERAVAVDSVLVWATGNNGRNQPNLQAGLPYYFPELRGNWLAVTSVASDGTRAPSANACGVAMTWCLAAPGGADVKNGVYSTMPGGTYAYKYGTSMATPYVTGAVAIAREMFPRASGSQLAQIVLQTSKDIGAPGIDDTFGWGLLSVDNLVETINPRGAALFASTAWGRFATLSQIGSVVSDRLTALSFGGDVTDSGAPPDNSRALAFASRSTGAQLPFIVVRDVDGAGGGTLARESGSPRVWTRALAGTAALSSGAVSPGASGRIAGGLAGVDLVATPNLLFGLAAGGTSTNIYARNVGDSSSAAAWHVLAYGGMEHDGVFMNAVGGWSRFDQDFVRRYIPGTTGTVIAATTTGAAASSRDNAYFVQGRFGWTWNAAFGQIKPYAHAAVRAQGFGGFQESGAGVFALSAPSAHLSDSEYGAGVRWIGPALDARMGALQIAPTADVAYLRMRGGAIQAQTELLGTAIVGETCYLGADALRAGAGVAFRTPDSLLAGHLSYSGTFRVGASFQMFSGGLSMRF